MPTSCPIRLIAIDIDGTLLDAHYDLPERNRRAVHRALDQGIEVVLATGRAFHHALPVAEALAPGRGRGAPPLIVNNGGLTKRADGVTLDRRLVPRGTARALVRAMRSLRPDAGVALIFDRPDERQYVCEGIDWSHPNRSWYYERNRKFITEVAPIETALTEEDPVQVAFNGGVGEMRKLASAIRKFLRTRRKNGPEVALTLTEYDERDFSLLDVMAAGCSKGAALAACARRLGIDPAAVMAVGDNLNDLEMLEFAGRPVVMGNAVEEIRERGRKRGWRTTGTHDACGLADAIHAALADASGPCGRSSPD